VKVMKEKEEKPEQGGKRSTNGGQPPCGGRPRFGKSEGKEDEIEGKVPKAMAKKYMDETLPESR